MRKQDGTIGWYGTGFMIIKNVGEKQYRPFLVTNKHVLFGKQSVVIRLQKKDSDQLITIDVPVVKNNEKLYSVHPDDKVDSYCFLFLQKAKSQQLLPQVMQK